MGYLTDLQDPVAKRVTIEGLDGCFRALQRAVLVWSGWDFILRMDGCLRTVVLQMFAHAVPTINVSTNLPPKLRYYHLLDI